jgi:hypothetical protein
MSSIVVLIIVIGGLGWAGVSVSRRSHRAHDHDVVTGRTSGPQWNAERTIVYALSFAGLVATLYATAGLVATLVTALTQQSSEFLSGSDTRDRTSYYLASLIIGCPLWLGLWVRAQRSATRTPDERQAQERRWYLAGIFGLTAVVALFGLQEALHAVLTLPGESNTTASARDAIFAGCRLLVWGAAWLAYARLGWTERRPQDDDTAHDLAVYVAALSSLAFFLTGAWMAIRGIAEELMSSGAVVVSSQAHLSAWGGVAAWLLAGGPVWFALWKYDLARGGQRPLRVVYLYLICLVAAPLAMGSGVDLVFECLRRAFGFSGNWNFLRDVLPAVLVGGAAWAYHWMVMRRQAAIFKEDRVPAGAILWPRYPGIALLDLGGLVLAAVACTSLLWLALDFAFHSGTALSGGDWWRDRISGGIAGAFVGGALWFTAWSLMQRAAGAEPGNRPQAQIRRRVLALITLVGTLTAIGFAVAMLWSVFRALLGSALDTAAIDGALKDLSAVAIALVLAGYHGWILRREQPEAPKPKPVRVLVLVAPGAEPMLAELRSAGDWSIEVLGRIASGDHEVKTDVAGLRDGLTALASQAGMGRALLILGPDGGRLYPYTGATMPAAVAAPEPVPPGRPASKAPEVGSSLIDPA